MLIMKSGKRYMTEAIDLSNQYKIRTLCKKKTYKYFEKLEPDTIKQVDMKGKIKKGFS